MLDSRFEEDTLFMVFEEDYRFEQEDPGWSGAALASSASEPAAGARGATPRDRVQLAMANKDPSCASYPYAACPIHWSMAECTMYTAYCSLCSHRPVAGRELALGWFSAGDWPAHVVRQRQRMRMRRQRMHMRVRWLAAQWSASGRPLRGEWMALADPFPPIAVHWTGMRPRVADACGRHG